MSDVRDFIVAHYKATERERRAVLGTLPRRWKCRRRLQRRSTCSARTAGSSATTNELFARKAGSRCCSAKGSK